eukprot:4016324-Amphidinium_carterae.1
MPNKRKTLSKQPGFRLQKFKPAKTAVDMPIALGTLEIKQLVMKGGNESELAAYRQDPAVVAAEQESF